MPIDLYLIKNDHGIKVDMWQATRKTTAGIRSVCSHIKNMFVGVQKGYRYKMRFVYAHFPINLTVENAGKDVEIRNFLGEKIVRRVTCLEGITCQKSKAAKDELLLQGNDLENLGQSCA